MAYFEWQDRLDVGVDAMNGEHKRLIEIMNRLHARNAGGADRQELARIVVELADYTVEHFAHEERFMSSVGYPEVEKHKLIHRDLLEKLGGHRARFEKAGGTLDEEFFAFLKLWLVAHIQGLDKKYGAHTQTSGRAA
jgi:hemerythrin-like metal-binding protein